MTRIRRYANRFVMPLLALLLLGCQTAATPTAAPTAAPKPTEAPAKAASTAEPAAPSPQPAAKPTEKATSLIPVKYASQRPVSDAGIFIAHGKGYFRQEGLDVEIVDFPSANDMIPALGTGQIDTGGVSPIAAFFNAVARGVDIKSVAERGSNSPGHGYNAVVVRKDLMDSGKFKDFADLKGKRVGVSPPVGGGSLSVDLLVALEKAGLKWEDVDVKSLGFQDMDDALRGGSLDIAFSTEPWVTRSVAGGYGVRWKGVDEIYPNHMVGGLAYSPVFAAQKPEAARAFMVAYVRAVRDYNDAITKGKGKEEVFSILTTYSTVKDRAVIEKMVLPGISPDPFVNRDSVARDLDAYIKLGTVKDRVDINKIIDDQYVKYAVDKLGRYQ